MITRFYLPLLSTNVKHPKFGCHVISLCQSLRRSAGSGACGGEDPENQVESVARLHMLLGVFNIFAREMAAQIFTSVSTLTWPRFR